MLALVLLFLLLFDTNSNAQLKPTTTTDVHPAGGKSIQHQESEQLLLDAVQRRGAGRQGTTWKRQEKKSKLLLENAQERLEGVINGVPQQTTNPAATTVPIPNQNPNHSPNPNDNDNTNINSNLLKNIHEQIDYLLEPQNGDSISYMCDNPTFLPPDSSAVPVTLRVPKTVSTWVPSGTIHDYHKAHVDEMLLPFKGGIPKSLLDGPAEFFDNSRGGCQNEVKIKIKDNKLYVRFSVHRKPAKFMDKRKLYTVSFFDDYVKKCSAESKGCLNFESNLCYADMSWEASKGIGFHLVWGGMDSGTLPLTIGEHNMPATIQASSDDLLVKTRGWREKYPWESRVSKAIFRGGASGRNCVWNVDGIGEFVAETSENAEHLSHFPKNCARVRLKDVFGNCDPGKKYIDVGIDAPYISLADQEAYKYIIYSEGNSGWANRLRALLAMGTTVLQQNVPTYLRTGSEPRQEVWSGQEWFTRYIEKWVHTVPVDKQWNALVATVKWLGEHDDIAKKISENADAFVDFFFSVESMSVYSDLLVRGYSELMQWEVEVEAGKDLPIEQVPLELGAFSALVAKYGTDVFVPSGT